MWGSSASMKAGCCSLKASSNENICCLIQRKAFSGTRATDIESRIKSYQGKVWHYGLYRDLYESENERLSKFLLDHTGIAYDQLGAFRAGGIGLSFIESLLRPADLSSLFCSEFVCAAHADIGLFQTSHVSRWSPNKFIRAERRQGVITRPLRLK